MENEEQPHKVGPNIRGVAFQFYALDTGAYGVSRISGSLFGLVGLDSSPDDLFPIVLSIVHEDDRDAFMASIREAVEACATWDFEGRFVKTDGEVRWFHAWSAPTRLEDRVVFDGVFLDVTETRLAEERSRQSEEKFAKIFMTAPDMIGITRADDGLIVDVNLGFEEITGWKRSEVIGLTSLGIGFWADPAERLRMVEDLQAGRDVMQRSIEFRRKDGSLRTGVYSARFVNISGEQHLIFVMQDITEYRRTAQRLQENQERLRGIAESIPGSVFQAYADERGEYGLSYASGSLAEHLGISVEMGTLLSAYISRIHEDDREGFMASLNKAVAACAPWDYEGRFITQEGEEVWFHGRATPRRFENRLIYNGILLDVTESKRAEQEREKLQAQLQQAQKMESVGRLAGGVAHDFNNMLTVILGHAELATMQCDPEDELYASLRTIRESALRSAGLVQQLLAFARKQTVAPKVLNLNNTVASMFKMLQRLIGEDIDFEWRPGADLGPVRIDPSQIDQVLANLCVNSRDAIAGVGKITIETRNAAFSEAYCETHAGAIPGEYVMLAVSDNGCGMDRETANRIFEPFFTTKETGKGTGLGLATVYGIVKQNGGFVSVYSEPGAGSTFKVYLPRFYGEVSATVSKTFAEPPRGRGEIILLVEDVRVVLVLAKAMLERLGYTVIPADTPTEAIRIAGERGSEIRMLVTDVVMPEMNGRDLARVLQEMIPGLKCLFMSGYTADAIAHHGILDEGVSFLEKPFSVKGLADKVREVLDQE